MDDTEFDAALIAAAFNQAAATGWPGLSIVEAARSAGLPLDRARVRFPGPGMVLMRFGILADTAALAVTAPESNPRDQLFDLLMRRFDVLQQHRSGMVALLKVLPCQPLLAMALGAATLRSMAWMLEAAGLSAAGLRGIVRAKTLVGVWVYALRAWKDDESPDLSGTMAAMDKALDQAERVFDLLKPKVTKEADDPLEGVVDLPPNPVDPLPESGEIDQPPQG